MSLVIDAPEIPPAEVQTTLDDAPAFATSYPVPSPQSSPSCQSLPTWWRAMLNRFSQRQAPSRLGYGPPESAVDYLAREQPFLYIKVLSG